MSKITEITPILDTDHECPYLDENNQVTHCPHIEKQPQPDILPVDLSIALDFSSTPMLFVTNEFVIKYLNFRALSFFQTYQKEFQAVDNDFNPNLLIDHKFEYIQVMMEAYLDDVKNLTLGGCVSAYLNTGRLYLELRFTPIFSKEYARVGTCIEIHDKTTEFQALNTLDIAITEASKGNFSYQINTHSMDNNLTFKLIYKKINELFSCMNRLFGDISVALEKLISGDLTHFLTINEADLHNSLVSLTKQDLNYTLQQMAKFVKNAKLSSKLMKDSINHIVSNSSDLAMTTESEEKSRSNILDNLDRFILTMRNSHVEIQQAVEIVNTVRSQTNGIEELKNTFLNVSSQLRTAFDITKFLEHILKTHLSGLREGLEQVRVGNMGKGVSIISHECEEMISKTNSALSQVRESMQKVNLSINNNNSSIENMLDALSINMNQMEQLVDLMSTIMGETQKSLEKEHHIFDEVKGFIQEMSDMRENTFKSIEKTVLLVSSLAYVNQELEALLNNFSVSDEEIKENHQKMDKLQQLSDTIVTQMNHFKREQSIYLWKKDDNSLN